MAKKMTMKKLLLLTSLLASTAGIAAADISVSGDARMGVTSTDGGDKFNFSSRARVRFTASGETDDGLKFGAVIRANESVDAATTGALGTVFIESPTMGKLTFGDADGAAQAAVTQFVPIGFDDTGKLQEFVFLTGGSTGKARDALYTYTNGLFAVSISAGDPGAKSAVASRNFSDDRAIGVSYTTEFWKLAAGFEDNGVNTQSIISGSYGNGQAEVKVAYGQRDDNADQFAVYGTYILSVNTFTVFYRKDFKDVDYKGIGISHDLGGGMAVSAGYAKADNAKALISVGALMSF
jgi:outer membrane protein OmpU